MQEIYIELDGIKYKVKYSFRALMMFEQLTDRKIDEMKQNVSDTLTIFYCILKANNKETFKYSFDEFIDAIDMFPDSIQVFSDFMTETANEQPKGSNDTAKKKKR